MYSCCSIYESNSCFVQTIAWLHNHFWLALLHGGMFLWLPFWEATIIIYVDFPNQFCLLTEQIFLNCPWPTPAVSKFARTAPDFGTKLVSGPSLWWCHL